MVKIIISFLDDTSALNSEKGLFNGDTQSLNEPGSYRIRNSATHLPDGIVTNEGVLVVLTPMKQQQVLVHEFFPRNPIDGAWYRICWYGSWGSWAKITG